MKLYLILKVGKNNLKMKKNKRIKLIHGEATVDENCSEETIKMLNKISEKLYNSSVKDGEIKFKK